MSDDLDAGYIEQHFSKESGAMNDFEMLSRYKPDVIKAYLAIRQAALDRGPVGGGGLPAHIKELIVLAIECARHKSNPPPVRHARLAIEAGATPAEVAEVVSICIVIGGMMTFAESGRFVLKAAEERAAELAREGQRTR